VEILERDFHLHFPADQVVIAPNGVDLERFASLPDPVTARRQTGLRAAPTVMCTGHLYAGRGADLFLQLAKSFPQAHFVWVGGRLEDIKYWGGRVESTNVTFTGFIPNRDLPLYQAAADVLLMPYSRTIMGSSGTADSASVASPMKMFEYMAAGRAIMTSDLPVIREVLNEQNAIFCPPDDPISWQTTLDTLLKNEVRRAALGRQARNDVQRYTWLSRAKNILNGFL
jgi:glycosyltransferase involved in cell wall biosynthesis